MRHPRTREDSAVIKKGPRVSCLVQTSMSAILRFSILGLFRYIYVEITHHQDSDLRLRKEWWTPLLQGASALKRLEASEYLYLCFGVSKSSGCRREALPFRASRAIFSPSANISGVTLVIKLLSRITVWKHEVSNCVSEGERHAYTQD